MNIKHGIITLVTAALLSVLLFSGCIAQTAAGKYEIKTAEENGHYYFECTNSTLPEGCIEFGVRFADIENMRLFIKNPNDSEHQPIKPSEQSALRYFLDGQISHINENTVRIEIIDPAKIALPEFGAPCRVVSADLFGLYYTVCCDIGDRRADITVYDASCEKYGQRYKSEKESYQNLCDKSGAVKETRSIDGVQRECISYKGEWRDGTKADVLTTWYTVEKNGYKAEVSRSVSDGNFESIDIFISDVGGRSCVVHLSNGSDTLLSDISDIYYPKFS